MFNRSKIYSAVLNRLLRGFYNHSLRDSCAKNQVNYLQWKKRLTIHQSNRRVSDLRMTPAAYKFKIPYKSL